MRTWAPAASGFAAPAAAGGLGWIAGAALIAGATLAALGAGAALGADALGAGWARSEAAIVSDIVAIASDTTSLFRACIQPC